MTGALADHLRAADERVGPPQPRRGQPLSLPPPYLRASTLREVSSCPSFNPFSFPRLLLLFLLPVLIVLLLLLLLLLLPLPPPIPLPSSPPPCLCPPSWVESA